MQIIGSSAKRVDAFDKVTGKAKYTPIPCRPMRFGQGPALYHRKRMGEGIDLAEAWKTEASSTSSPASMSPISVPHRRSPVVDHPASRTSPTASCSTHGYAVTGTTSCRHRRVPDGADIAVSKIKVVYEE